MTFQFNNKKYCSHVFLVSLNISRESVISILLYNSEIIKRY